MKSRNVLIMALVMALVTTFLFSRYLKQLEEKYRQDQNKVMIVVPRENISKNQKVTRDMLEYREFDLSSVHPQAVRRIEDIEGNYALTDLLKGEMLFPERFTNQYKESEEVTRKIREGYRAVSLEVNFVESVSNLVQPEDYVDLIFTEKINTTGTNTITTTQIVLENVRVLAVGKKLSEGKSNDSTQDGTAKKDQVDYVSVTLELKPADAVKLVNSDERGNIRLILRSKIAN